MEEEKQDYKIGFCKTEMRYRTFITSVSPVGHFICCSCGHRTEKLEEKWN